MARGLYPYNSRSGVALVLVLWLMTVLCAVALEVSLFSRLRLQATRNSGDAVRALFLARAGIERAIAELKEDRDGVESLDDLRENAERLYHSVDLAEGSYTLLADPRDSMSAEPEYGISDEAAKINLNSADERMLRSIPGIDPDLAADIILLRKENKTIHDIGDLLLIESVDELVLYGEDQNQNAILDANEDDGDRSWPSDNGDGKLERGLAAHLTCYSATRNVTATGEKRVNLSKASAQEIAKGVQGITQQQAESIVAHRDKKKLSSIADLLDVMLVEKTETKEEKPGARPETREEEKPSAKESSASSGSGESESESEAKPSESRGEAKEPKEETKTEVKTTDKKAFDVKQFKAIADLVTTSDEEVLRGLINVNTAPVEVLGSLPSVDEALAMEIWARRSESKFETIADLLDVQGMSVDKFKQICNLVSARSDVFSVRSFGVLGTDGQASAGIYCCVAAVIDRTGDKVKLKSWRELH